MSIFEPPVHKTSYYFIMHACTAYGRAGWLIIVCSIHITNFRSCGKLCTYYCRLHEYFQRKIKQNEKKKTIHKTTPWKVGIVWLFRHFSQAVKITTSPTMILVFHLFRIDSAIWWKIWLILHESVYNGNTACCAPFILWFVYGLLVAPSICVLSPCTTTSRFQSPRQGPFSTHAYFFSPGHTHTRITVDFIEHYWWFCRLTLLIDISVVQKPEYSPYNIHQFIVDEFISNNLLQNVQPFWVLIALDRRNLYSSFWQWWRKDGEFSEDMKLYYLCKAAYAEFTCLFSNVSGNVMLIFQIHPRYCQYRFHTLWWFFIGTILKWQEGYEQEKALRCVDSTAKQKKKTGIFGYRIENFPWYVNVEYWSSVQMSIMIHYFFSSNNTSSNETILRICVHQGWEEYQLKLSLISVARKDLLCLTKKKTQVRMSQILQ